MSREAMSEEERRRRRNEASRRCYLKRKAEQAAQAQPVGVKNKKPKAKPAEARQAKPVRRGPDPIVAAERLCRTYARVAGGIKPMIKDAAEFLSDVYKTEDQRVVEKVERVLAKGLGISVSRLAPDPMEKTRVCLDAVSKAVKTPKFRLDAQEDRAQFVPFPTPGEQPPQPEPEPLPEAPVEPEDDDEDEPAEVPVDPALLEKVDAGEADKSEIEIPQDKPDEDDEDDSDLDEDDEPEDEDDEDDDEDDESEEAQERRARRRAREESDSVREYETGRWEMMGEMGAQGAFDD